MTKHTDRGYPWPESGSKIAKTTSPEDSIREDFQSLAEAIDSDVTGVEGQLSQKIAEVEASVDESTIAKPAIGAGAYTDRATGFGDGHNRMLPLGFKEDGRFDDFTRDQVLEQFHDTTLHVSGASPWSELWLSGNGRIVLGIRTDGTVTIPGLNTGEQIGIGGTYVDAPWVPWSEILPLRTDMSKWWVIGSSTAEAIASYLTDSAAAARAEVIHFGKGGETDAQIMARMGVHPDSLTVPSGSIPSGVGNQTQVVSGLGIADSWMEWYIGFFEGTKVRGQLRFTGGQLVFHRLDSGPSTAIPAGTRFLSENGQTSRATLALFLGGGKNSLNGGSRDAQIVIQGWRDQHAWLAPQQKRFLRMGLFGDTGTPSNSVERAQINEVNAWAMSALGMTFIDVQAYLCGSKIWTDTGLSPTSTDLAEQSKGNIAPTLSDGSIYHMGPAAYQAVVDHLIVPRLRTLTWID